MVLHPPPADRGRPGGPHLHVRAGARAAVRREGPPQPGWPAAQDTRPEKRTPRSLEQLLAWWRSSALLKFGRQTVDGLLQRCRTAGEVIRARVDPHVDTVLAAVVFTVRRMAVSVTTDSRGRSPLTPLGGLEGKIPPTSPSPIADGSSAPAASRPGSRPGTSGPGSPASPYATRSAPPAPRPPSATTPRPRRRRPPRTPSTTPAGTPPSHPRSGRPPSTPTTRPRCPT